MVCGRARVCACMHPLYSSVRSDYWLRFLDFDLFNDIVNSRLFSVEFQDFLMNGKLERK